MLTKLLRARRFGPFFITQALGVFNDNLFKNALVILITYQLASTGSVNVLVNGAAGLFILPFFLFSATCGQIADKYEKSALIRWVKLLEIGIMTLAAIGFWMGSISVLLVVLFLMGCQSTLFGPVKYGILPQHLHDTELTAGNGLVEMGTFLAILLGTIVGGLLIALGSAWVAVLVVAVALAGWFASRFIPAATPAAPNLAINWNPITETWRNFRFMRQHRVVFLSVLGISWFWFFGATFLAQMPNFTRVNLFGNEQVVTLLLALFSVGVGIGSLLCERLSGHRVEIGLVPFGSLGLTAFGVDLYFAVGHGPAAEELMGAGAFMAAAGSGRVMFDLVMLGLFGGFYIVPLYALIQQRSPREHLSRIIAGNNILNALFMVVSALMAMGLLSAGLSIPQLLLLTAVLNAVVAIYIYSLVPEFLMRFLVWLLIHTIYRVRARGLENIPEEGPALIVCNHVSFVDALIIGGMVRRPVRFVMYYRIFKVPVLNFIFRTAKAIPIAGHKEDPQMLQRAWDRIAKELDAGEVVGIFPEGELTGDGEIGPFKPGLEKIIERTPVPVIPMALRGLWGSLFSRRDGKLRRRRPRKLWAEIELVAGNPVPPNEASAENVEQQVRKLRGEHA